MEKQFYFFPKTIGRDDARSKSLGELSQVFIAL